MTALLERLREANDLIQTYLSANAEASALSMGDDGWQALSPVAEKIHALAASLDELHACADGVELQTEVERYTTNITRLQKRCQSAIAELESQRREIWREEQALRSQQRWQTESPK